MTKPYRRISQFRIVRDTNEEHLCFNCSGPGLADMDTNPDWQGDMYYRDWDGEIFCSISCIEEWHGITLH